MSCSVRPPARSIAVLLLLPLLVSARRVERSKPQDHPSGTAPAYVTHLAAYDFDDGAGGPDPQGWTTADLTTRPDTFTHVDDFAGLPAPAWTPIEGARSLWIGARNAPELCDYVNLPGYGNQWAENFQSIPFATTGDATISYIIRYDTEVLYDPVTVDYRSKTGAWRRLAEYSGPTVGGPGSEQRFDSYTVPADSLDGTAQFRFHFTSDGVASDEDGLYTKFDSDGAAILDSITVSDAGGVVDYQDFENDPVGARATSDGHWQAGISDYFGDFAGLVDGTTVLQEDSLTVNTTWFWAFFNRSADTYACGGHPEQASIPILPVVGYTNPHVYIADAAVSPIIDLTRDKNGDPVPGPPDHVSIEYDVYTDLVPNSEVYYNLAVRVFQDGCFNGTWLQYNPSNTGPNKAWHHEQTVVDLNGPATHIQVRLFVVDYGWDGIHTCNSQAPMFDNVTVDGYFDTATGVRDVPEASYRLHPNAPNPFNPTTSISFDVPAGGGRVRVAVYDVNGAWVATLTSRRWTAGTHAVTWNGRDASGRPAASGVYFCRLEASGVELSRKMVFLK